MHIITWTCPRFCRRRPLKRGIHNPAQTIEICSLCPIMHKYPGAIILKYLNVIPQSQWAQNLHIWSAQHSEESLKGVFAAWRTWASLPLQYTPTQQRCTELASYVIMNHRLPNEEQVEEEACAVGASSAASGPKKIPWSSAPCENMVPDSSPREMIASFFFRRQEGAAYCDKGGVLCS